MALITCFHCKHVLISDHTLHFSYPGAMPILQKLLTWYGQMLQGGDIDSVMESPLFARITSMSELAYANVQNDERGSLGVKSNGLILRCTYKGEICNPEDFKHYLHPTFINCYTFKPNRSSENSEILTGPQHGLSLILRSEASSLTEYNLVDHTDNTDSIRVSIHSPNTVPLLKNDGINLEPGKSTSVSLMMKKYERLGQPYVPCKGVEFLTLNDREFESTSNVCREICVLEALQKQCNCTSTMFEDLVPHNKYQYCLVVGPNDGFHEVNDRITCEIDFINKLPELSCDHCIWGYNEIKYETQIAFAQWPHEIRAPRLVRLLLKDFRCDHPLKHYFTSLVHSSKVDPAKVLQSA